MDVAIGLAVLVLAVLGYAVVNSIEIAVVGANPIRIRHLAEQGSRSAQALERLSGRQERFFAVIVLLQNILAVLAASIGSLVAVELAGGLGVVIAVPVIAVATAEFGELTPKVLAAHASDRFALLVAGPTEVLVRLLSPIAAVLGFIPAVLSRSILGVRLHAGPSVSEAELRMLIETSAEAGHMAIEEAELLDRVFHFGDRQVHEAMIPRTEVVWIERQSTVAAFYETYSRSPHSRFPVFEGDSDHVVGILGIKDVLAAIAERRVQEDSPINALVRPAYFVPETKLVGELFREMQATGTQMAIAIDEFGGTAGIVTLELLLEEMFGPLRDELRVYTEEIQPVDERTTRVDGGLSVDEAREELGLDIPEGPYDTIAGFVLSRLGHIPAEGEQLEIDGVRITVSEMRGPKIELLTLTRT